MLGIYDAKVKTPNLDVFARESVVFDRAYSSCPLCSPHRGCLLTGKQPIATNVFTNCKPDVESYLREEDLCVSDVLKSAGYQTGYIGKWHLDKPNMKDDPLSWDAYTPPGRKRHGFDFWYSYGADNDHMHPHYWNTEGKRIDVSEWSPAHETDVALEFMEQNKGKQFALFLSYNPPHAPYDLTPEKYRELYRGDEKQMTASAAAPEGVGDELGADWDQEEAVKGYYGAVSGLDENIGRIIRYLKETGLYKDTYLFISADHGDMLGDHGRCAKHIWYEGSVGIPLIIGGGDVEPMRTDELISSPDQTATILGMLGIAVPDCMQGKDFSPLIRREPFDGQKSIMTVAFPNTGERIDEFEKNGENFYDFGWRSIVTKDYKLAVSKGQKFGEEPKVFLYDLKNDPDENECLENEMVLEDMLNELKKWCQKTGDGFCESLNYGNGMVK